MAKRTFESGATRGCAMTNHPDRGKRVPDENEHAKRNAAAWLESIHDMAARYDAAVSSENGDGQDEISAEIQESVPSVEVRGSWHVPGRNEDGPEEYMILLSTGGPALRIIGGLGQHNEPVTANLQWQDWGTPWTEYQTTVTDDKALTAFAQQFYFGE